MRKIAAILLIGITLRCLCPSLSVSAQQPSAPGVSAVSAILIDAVTGDILYEKNAYERRAMASITKIMTTLLTLESGDLDTPFTVDAGAIQVEGSSMGLKEGDIVTKRVLCYGMMLPSGNDAANAAAVAVAGSLGEFAKLMNAKAKELGMNDSSFVTPSGLDADGHYTTARDMAILTRYALQNPLFKEICATKEVKVSYGNPPYDRWLYNGNRLLNMYCDCVGVKTGFTDNARRTLVCAAQRAGVTLIAVTLNAPDDWNDHMEMFEYGFSLMKSRSLDYDYAALRCDVVGALEESVGVSPASTPAAGLTDEQVGRVTARVLMEPFVYAPVSAGDIVGEVEFAIDGNRIAATSLVAVKSVDAYILDIKPGFFESIIDFFKGIFKALGNLFG